MVFLTVGVIILTPAVSAGGGDRVVVTYYHGTLRCHTCLEIERLSRNTLAERFAERLKREELEWRTVDYDLPKNAAALERYNLSSPSLVISRFRDSREIDWRVAEGTWREIKISPGALMDYVEREVRESMSTG